MRKLKNHFLARAAMTLLVALLGSITGAWAQETTLTVCDGTKTNSYIPVFGSYVDTQGTTSEFIIPAETEGMSSMVGVTITKLTFYISGNPDSWGSPTIQLYMGEVEGTTLSSVNGPTNFDVVATGVWSNQQSTIEVEFNEPYTYEGGNLLIGTYVQTKSSTYKQTFFFGVEALSGSSRYSSSGPGTTGTAQSFLPKTTFTYTPGTGVVYKKPTNLTVSGLTSDGATISWTAPEGSPTDYAYQYKKATDEEWSTEATIPATSTSVSINGLAAATAYNFQVKAIYSEGESGFASTNFTTECDAYDIPYTYGFEEAVPLGCWTVISGNVSRQSSYSNSGSYRLDFRGSTSNMIALPQFNAPTNILRMEFYTRPESDGGSSGKFAIGYMTDITDASTFVAVETYNSTEMATSYVKKKVDFADAPANAIIAMRQFDCATNYYWYVDDVTVKAIPSCLAPTALTADNITTTSAELSWTSGANAWTVYYKKSTTDTYNEVPNVTENSYTLTGLDAASSYQFYVVANCSDTDSSEPSEVFTFITECDVINALGYSENFDGITVASTSSRTLPICWSYINKCTNSDYKYYPTIYNSSSYAKSTPNSLRFYSFYSSYYSNYDPQPQYAILPPMENLAGKQVRLKARGYNTSSTFKIGTMSDPTDASTFTLIAEQNGLTTSYPEAPFEYLIPATCTDCYVAIMIDAASSSRTSNSVYIDDIEIREAPTCLKPTDLAVTATTTNTATLSWTNGAEGQDAWQICINGDETNLISADGNPFTVEELTPGTPYTAKVRAYCSADDQSDWSKEINFTTQCEANTEYPWTENFDDHTTGTGVLPDCWNRINTTTYSSYSSNPYLTNTSAHSGSNCLRLYSYASYSNGSTTYDPQPQYAILPPMKNLAGKQIMLQAKDYNSSSTFKIGTMSNPLDASTFTLIAEQTLTTSYPEDPYEYLIPANCTDSYVAIMIDAASQERNFNGVYIDDIVIRKAPTCIKPTSLAVTANSITADGATITWTAGGSETSWQIEFSKDVNFTDPFYETAEGEPTYTFHGLDELTTYYVHVQAVCGGSDGSSEYSKTVIFTTLQTPVNLPYSNDFESTNDWRFLNGNLTNAWAWGEAANNGGTHALYISNDGGTTNAYTNSNSYTMVYATKTFNFEAGTYVFSYDWKANGESTYDYLRVALVPSSVTLTAGTSVPSNFSSSTLPTGWIALDGGTKLNLQSEWQSHVSNEINIATAGTYIMVFAWKNDNSSGDNPPAAIDNVSIEVITCKTPTNLTAPQSGITATSAQLSWTETGEATAWEIELTDENNNTLTIPVTEEDLVEGVYTIASLTSETVYTAKVRANCGDGYSRWSEEINFETAKECQTPDGLAATATSDEAVISWNAYGLTDFNLRYGTDGENWTTIPENVTNPYTLASLTPATTYYVQVQPTCADEETWSAQYSFTTDCEAKTITVEDPFTEGFEGITGTHTYSETNGIVPTCWDCYSESTVYPHIINSGSYYYVHEGSGTMYFKGEANTNSYLALPIFTNDLSTLVVNFWMQTENADNGTLSLGYITDADVNFNSYQVIKTYDNTTTMKQCQTYLGSNTIPSNATRLVFRWQYTGTSWYGACIDDVVVKLPVDITLADNATNNASTIEGKDGAYANVTLNGRTLYRDSYWNTLCLPFGTELTGDLDGATLMELDTENYYDANGNTSTSPAEGYHKTGLEGTTLYLNFKNANEIVAGAPYIIKWNTAVTPDIVNPVFSGVTIDNSTDATNRMTVAFSGGQFLGTYEWQQFTTEDKSILFLGANSTLFYPQPAHEDPNDETSAMINPSIGAFRAYFHLDDINAARRFVLNFGDDETTGIVDIQSSMFNVQSNNAWYDLQGRKVNGQSSMVNGQLKKGLYIHGGKKVVIK